jgi:uncharacterized membrane protein YjfL (UPF0719 family)
VGLEITLMVDSALLAVLRWWFWYLLLGAVSRRFSGLRQRLPLYLAPPLCLALLFLALHFLAATTVRVSLGWQVFYLVVGSAWIGLASGLLQLFGLNAYIDVAERRNGASGIAICGALLALTLCFAGANVGEGPGALVVLFCAALSTGGLFLCWILFELLTDAADAITIDRDRAAGLRLGGLLVACGLVLGAAVAGDWVSPEATWRDFLRDGWPALVLTLLAAVVERRSAPTPQRPGPPLFRWGMIPATAYLALAALVVGWRVWRS